MSQPTILIWYRNDLRIHDSPTIYHAGQQNAQIIPFYCFDIRQFATTSFGFPKTGKFRAQFLLESVANLRNSLQQLGSNLIVRIGIPETIIPDLASSLNCNIVYFQKEITAEELAVENALIKNLKAIQIQVKSFSDSTLYHPEDLPFSQNEIPELFTNFRKQLERNFTIRDVFPTPKNLPPLTNIESNLGRNIEIGNLPTLSDFGLEKPQIDKRSVLNFQGGERAGKNRLKHYIWEEDCLKNYKETRNQMLGGDYSSKFSPWLANGCLSPRYIYQEVTKYENQRVKNQSTYWLIFELLWRDFFKFIAAKHGNKIFYLSGLQGIEIPWLEDWEKFSLWQEGKTGFPLVDANMRELKLTGFMSNRGRQNVASFLTKNLGINWQMGAQWFESLLIDYDVCSNWGNWNYTAGIGNDARGFRYFNIPKQSKNYDPNGQYLRHWLPELTSIVGDKIHEPQKLSKQEQINYNVIIGKDYPCPIVNFFKSIKTNESIYNAAVFKD